MIPDSAFAHLSVLNVGDGDTVFSFDPDKPEECKRARKVVQQMLKAGYRLFVRGEDGKSMHPVKRFDPEHDTYIIEEPENAQSKEESPGDQVYAGTPRKAAKKRRTRVVPAHKARVTAVGRTAGG